MLDSKYLYDADIKDHMEKPYKDVLIIKVYLAKKLMSKLVIDNEMRDNQRMTKVHKAIQFNIDLLKESGFDDKSIYMALKDIEQII